VVQLHQARKRRPFDVLARCVRTDGRPGRIEELRPRRTVGDLRSAATCRIHVLRYLVVPGLPPRGIEIVDESRRVERDERHEAPPLCSAVRPLAYTVTPPVHRP